MAFWSGLSAWVSKALSRLFGRSSAVGPTALAVIVWMAFLVALLAVHAPFWLTVTATAFLGATLATFLFQNVYFTIKDPNALRGEGYQIQRDALEYLAGDNEHGFRREVRIEGDQLVAANVPDHPRVRVQPEIANAPLMTEAEAQEEQEADDPEESVNAERGRGR